MDIVGDRKFVEVPGEKMHELPPLLVRTSPNVKRLDRVVGMANDLIDADDMIPLPPMEGLAQEHEADRRKMDLAINLVDQYLHLITQWQWGDSILEWIRQCEITFESEDTLRKLLHPDVWPHASRASFVELLREKALPVGGVTLQKAVGLRLTFRQPPPIDCFSNQFLLYLDSPVADSAYQTWSHLVTNAPALLPPDRFHFDVVDVSVS